VHGKGRIWKVTFGNDGATEPAAPPVTDARKRAAKLRESKDIAELAAALDDADPATAQAAAFGLSRLPDVEKIAWDSMKTARQRIGLLDARSMRGANLEPLVWLALKDTDDRVKQMAVRCVTEQQLVGSRPFLDYMLHSHTLSPRLLAMTVAAMNQLDGDKAAKVDSKKINSILLDWIDIATTTDIDKAMALHMMQSSHPKIPLEKIRGLAVAKSVMLQVEAVRYLGADTNPARFEDLLQIATDGKRDASVRAEAVLGIATDVPGHVDALLKLTGDDEPAVRAEALRALRPVGQTLSSAQKDQLKQVASKFKDNADLVSRIIDPPPTNRPAESDEAAWQKILAGAPGNPEAGRRIFFHPSGPNCSRCHMIEGRGKQIGPDLSMIGNSRTRDHVLESILDPSREIAPLYTQFTITTKSGDKVIGMLLRRDGQANEIYVDASGQETKVSEPTVVDRKMRPESIMPTGLAPSLTDQELRDLIAFLMQKR
jgi:putative heme-binding domain-containing protein